MGSYAKERYTRSLLAAVDLSSSQYLYVGDNGSGKANVIGGTNGAHGFGFLMNNPQADEACEIADTGGGAQGVAAEVITLTSSGVVALKADAEGKMRNAIVGDKVCAVALESAAVGDQFEVLPVKYVQGAAPVVLPAGADLSTSQYFYVKDNGSGAIVASDTADEKGNGFLLNAPDSAEDAIVSVPGDSFAKGISAAAFASGAELQSAGNGKLQTAGAGVYVVAIALEAATAADEVINLIPVLYQKN